MKIGRLMLFLAHAVVFVLAFVSLSALSADSDPARERVYQHYLAIDQLVEGGRVDPHWLDNGDRFWYETIEAGRRHFYLVDPEQNDSMRFVDEKSLRSALPLETPTPSEKDDPSKPRYFRDRYPYITGPLREIPSPDGQVFAYLHEHNVWLRYADGRPPKPLTEDGVEHYEWDANLWTAIAWAHWSPDGKYLAVAKYDRRQGHKMPLVDWLSTDEKVEYQPYTIIGDPMPRAELYVIDVSSGERQPIDIGDGEYYLDILGFRKKPSQLLFARLTRDSKRLDVLAADFRARTTRVVLTEQTDKLLFWTPYFLVSGAPLTLFDDGDSLVLASERSGWRQLYLYDVDDGLVRQLSSGEHPVIASRKSSKGGYSPSQYSEVHERSGDANGVVYYTAHSDQSRPYDLHLHRVNLDGTGERRLTSGEGDHQIKLSPSGKYFLDSWSRVDMPPKVSLHRTEDGARVRTLSEANIDALRRVGWVAPEPFVVKAADRKTDLHGVMYKPYDFDPKKKYPVVEYIYGGPQVAVTPRSFGQDAVRGTGLVHQGFARAVAQLGFIVVVQDARGTPGRGRAFQEVAYGDIADHVVMDHAGGLKQLFARHDYMDDTRVGIFGVSFGGYFTVRSMLLAPDTYHVAVSSAPVELGPGVRYSGPEGYLGLLNENPAVHEASRNVPLANRLRGKIRIIIGTNDVNTPFSHSLRLADAFVQADKPYEMVVLPGANHLFQYRGSTEISKYWLNAIRTYLVEELDP